MLFKNSNYEYFHELRIESEITKVYKILKIM